MSAFERWTRKILAYLIGTTLALAWLPLLMLATVGPAEAGFVHEQYTLSGCSSDMPSVIGAGVNSVVCTEQYVQVIDWSTIAANAVISICITACAIALLLVVSLLLYWLESGENPFRAEMPEPPCPHEDCPRTTDNDRFWWSKHSDLHHGDTQSSTATG